MNKVFFENWIILFIILIVPMLIVGFLYFLWKSNVYHDYNISAEDILNDSRTQSLALNLNQYNPLLFTIWSTQVIPSSQRAVEEERMLKELRNEEETLETKEGKLKAEIESKTEILENIERPATFKPSPKPETLWHEHLLSIGLSLMLFLGVYEHLRNFSTNPLLNLTLAAVCVVFANFAEYKLINNFVTVSYQHKKKLNPLIVFEWKQLVRNPNFWICMILLILEVSFAAPGLLNLVSPVLADKYGLIIFAGCGLFAFINLGLAWSEAIKTVETEIQYQTQIIEEKAEFQAKQETYLKSEEYQAVGEAIKKRKQQLEEIAELKTQYGEVSAKLRHLRSHIDRVTKNFAKHTDKALREYRRWEINYRVWELFNGKKAGVIKANAHYFPDDKTPNNNGNKQSKSSHSS